MELDEAIRLYEMNYDSQLVIHGEFNIISLFKKWFRFEINFPSLYQLFIIKTELGTFLLIFISTLSNSKLLEIVLIVIYLL